MNEYLKPARISKVRLADYGIFSYVPCLRLKLCLEPAAAQAMHEMLLTLHTPGRKSSCKTATLKGFRLPAVPPWAKHIGEPILVQLSYHRHALLVEAVGVRGQLRHEKRARPNVFWLFCASIDCNYAHDCARRQLHAKHTWKPIHCKGCARHFSAARWLCVCKVPWHTCPSHRAEGFACGTFRKPPKPKESLPPPKRRTTPLGGILGAQWTDSVTHVPISVPALPDQPCLFAVGSFEELVAHATHSDEG